MSVCARRSVLTLAALGAGALLITRTRRRGAHDADLWLPEAPRRPATPLALPARDGGAPSDRGSGTAVQFDLAEARRHHLEPVVEYLTYLQQQRGDGSHLLFVRYADLDALAAQDGTPVAEFLSRLDQLGVVVSQN
jgi:hypothetical protein